MKKFIKKICIILLILILAFSIVFYKNNNLTFLSIEDKNKLMTILEIENSESFNPIYKKFNGGFHGSDPDYYEIKFEISIEDYEKNNLVYYEESYYDILTDCHYKEKKSENTYTCVLRVSNIQNKELFDKIREI